MTMNAIPPLTNEGVLPSGLYRCTIEEVEERFGCFQKSDKRVELTKKLKEYLSKVRATGLVDRVVVDGSYVTSKDEPGDIDLIVVLRADHDFTGELRPFEYNVVSRKQVRRTFGFDVVVVADKTPALSEKLEFFQQTRDGTMKGLLEVLP